MLDQTLQPDRSPHQLGDTPFTVQGVSTILAIVVAVLAIIGYFEKKRRDTETTAKSAALEMENRLRQGADERADQQEAANVRLLNEITKHNETFDKRLSVLESSMVEVKVKLQDFVPKGEIDRQFDHMRNNLKAMDQATAHAIQRHDEAIANVRIEVGRLDTKMDSATSGIHGLEERMKEISREMSAGFEKMREQLSGMGSRR